LPLGGCALHASISVSWVIAISITYSGSKPVFRKEEEKTPRRGCLMY